MPWVDTKRFVAVGVLVTGPLLGCSSEPHDSSHDASAPTGCAAEPRADAFALGLAKTLPNGSVVRLVAATPTPPAKGDNTWTVEIVDAAGKPVSGATVAVVPFMPDHGHGTAVAPTVTPEGGPGKYLISKMNLPMAGYWDITLSVTVSGAKGEVRFGICIDG